jgi:hypothetical protein
LISSKPLVPRRVEAFLSRRALMKFLEMLSIVLGKGTGLFRTRLNLCSSSVVNSLITWQLPGRYCGHHQP